MRPLLLIAGLAALLAAPATASCHGCVSDVVDECGSLDAPGCSARANDLVTHAPGLAQDAARDPLAVACDVAERVDCP